MEKKSVADGTIQDAIEDVSECLTLGKKSYQCERLYHRSK